MSDKIRNILAVHKIPIDEWEPCEAAIKAYILDDIIGEDETLQNQSEYDLKYVPHKETDQSVLGEMLFSVRQATRNLMRVRQRDRL